MKAHIHYEAAFEHFLRQRQTPYVAVAESKKAIFRDAKLKSFDFIVYAPHEPSWLVDIKGRRWAARGDGRKPIWENWITQADLDGLVQWQEVFGAGFRAMLVFAYWLDDGAADPPLDLTHSFHEQRYVFAGVPLDEYRLHARVRSPKWGTIHLPLADFARHVRPFVQWL
ncbi:MAG: hypothetical protein CHACPFDD_01482 [Phycisphaerae bacterium]|nr:hypothetical protein [Phycisphaerae bacterium]